VKAIEPGTTRRFACVLECAAAV